MPVRPSSPVRHSPALEEARPTLTLWAARQLARHRRLCAWGLIAALIRTAPEAPGLTPRERFLPRFRQVVDAYAEPPAGPPRHALTEAARAQIRQLLDLKTLGGVPYLDRLSLSECVEWSLGDARISVGDASALRGLLRDRGFTTRLDPALQSEIVQTICGNFRFRNFDRIRALHQMISDGAAPREAFYREGHLTQSALLAAAGPFSEAVFPVLRTSGFRSLDDPERASVVRALVAVLRPPPGADLHRYERVAERTRLHFEGWISNAAPPSHEQAEYLRTFVRTGRAPFLFDAPSFGPPDGPTTPHTLQTIDDATGRHLFVRIGAQKIRLIYPERGSGALPEPGTVGAALARRSPDELRLIDAVELVPHRPVADAPARRIRLFPFDRQTKPLDLEETLGQQIGHLVGAEVLGGPESRAWLLYRRAMADDVFAPNPWHGDDHPLDAREDFAATWARYRSIHAHELNPMFQHRFRFMDEVAAALKSLRAGG